MALIEDITSFGLGNLVDDDVLAKVLSRLRKGDVNSTDKSVYTAPADILSTPKEYIFYVDVPGLSKSDIQVKLIKICTETRI